MRIEIELEVLMILPREGIIITRYLMRPRQGFSLTEESRLTDCLIASLTITKALHADGAHRRDLVSFHLIDKRDTEKILPGQHVCLREVDPAGFFVD